LNSPVQKKELFSELFPHIPGTSKAILQRYRSNYIKEGQQYEQWIDPYLEKDYSLLKEILLTKYHAYLVEKNWLIPAGTPSINWDSVAQVLPIIQCVEKVKDLSAESLGRTSHPIISDYENFKDTIKLINSFGEKWLEKNVEPDGCVRTSFNQVVTTGRVSSSSPNMQQVPAKESVGNRYRNAFLPPPGWSFVSSDYVSQELIIIAYLSSDPVWAEALSRGQDLHSIAAEMVFGQKWKEAADPDCAYYHVILHNGKKEYAKEKCKCKKHKYMRNGVKTINFGLAYGMSQFKLASTLHISVQEAVKLIDDYFKAFPGIGGLLNYLGAFGVSRGYIQTIWPFYRRRWFPYWRHYIRFVDSHLMGSQYHPGLGEIERASKNMPIQGTSADITKVALCLLYWYIHENNLEDRVYLSMQVHDQVDTCVRNDYTEEWKSILTQLMEEAAAFIIPTGILKADTTITERWSK
jgi:DNA polymerase-1